MCGEAGTTLQHLSSRERAHGLGSCTVWPVPTGPLAFGESRRGAALCVDKAQREARTSSTANSPCLCSSEAHKGPKPGVWPETDWDTCGSRERHRTRGTAVAFPEPAGRSLCVAATGREREAPLHRGALHRWGSQSSSRERESSEWDMGLPQGAPATERPVLRGTESSCREARTSSTPQGTPWALVVTHLAFWWGAL